ncbi:hypothetical protein [Thiocapsa marina]|uniref:Uncharacterized protein n=1 Tax=Thiocapsa marina 5811 TaxID=768671 RepID=F9UC42_9GAMM|nr:hypothetical protein [Thiocapsa marina]EGV17955.1 hypothetical protein ThimaDRAFT_2494 [Thiocapsa marina 5811]
MPLVDLWKARRSSIEQMTIEQIASIAGDGKLLDNSDCQKELRQYLNEASTDSLADYATYCLENSFSKSGQILQDVVNELGRRLEYIVEDGRYQGVKNAIGFDGIWQDQSHTPWSLVVEVKTTDAYRLSLDTVAGYRNGLIESGRITGSSSVLIVVGRTDTGELEAQVRGSRHAWQTRIIGVESLIQLVRVKESADRQDTVSKIRTLLSPIEYTRIDDLVGVVFATARDIEESIDEVADRSEVRSEKGVDIIEKTAPEKLGEIRERVIAATSFKFDLSLIKKSRAMYWSPDQRLRVACAVSKRYDNPGIVRYWYAYLPTWDSFLEQGEQSFLALGCVDLEVAFLLPLDFVRSVISHLNVTEKNSGRKYWHVKIIEPTPGEYSLQVPSPGSNEPLSPYLISLAVATPSS